MGAEGPAVRNTRALALFGRGGRDYGLPRVETFLTQLEAQIALMAPADRKRIVDGLGAVLETLARYGTPKITGAAMFKFLGLLGIASASDGVDRFWEKVRAKAKATGPHVDAVFQSF